MKMVDWTDPMLERIVRLGFRQSPSDKLIEVESCRGVLKNGMDVEVRLPFQQLPKTDYLGAMLDYARRDGVGLRSLGIFNGAVISLLWRRAS